MDMRRAARPVMDWLTSQGIEHDPPEPLRGGHIRLTIRHDGQTRFVTLSISPSDRRVVLNQLRDCKRVLREMGWREAVD